MDCIAKVNSLMKRLIVLSLCLGMASPGWSAVAYGSSAQSVKGTGSSQTSGNLTISGSNLVIIAQATYSSTSITVSSVTWSLGGTGVEAKLIRGGLSGGVTTVIWCIPAPTGGTGTVEFDLSGSASTWRFSADYFTGADQTTPCPTGDAVTDITATNTYSLTPSNLTANDGTSIAGGDSSSSINSVSVNQILIDNTTSVDIGTGYTLGTGASGMTMSDSNDAHSVVAIRIAAASSAAAATSNNMPLMGM